MKLTALLQDLAYRVQADGAPLCPEREIHTVAAHTAQSLGADTLFFCLRTPVLDGTALAPDAFSRGCRTFVAERGLALPAEATVLLVDDVEQAYAALAVRLAGNAFAGLTVCAVAGARGKTTVIRMAEHVLQKAGVSTASLAGEGTFLAGRFIPRAPRVADAGEIVRFLTEAAACGAEVAFLECSDYLLAHKAVSCVPFAAVCVVGDPVESLDAALARAPFLLLPAGSVCRGAGRTWYFGAGGDITATARAEYAVRGVPGNRFMLTLGTERVPVTLPVPGDFIVEDALAALALCAVLDVPPAAAAAALATAHPRGTLCPLVRGKPFLVFRDGAFDAPRLTRVLRTLRAVTAGRLSVVIGSVGGRARERRAPLGLAAYTHADAVFLTADDPDDESAAAICREMTAALPDTARVRIIPDRAAAIREAVRTLRAGDTLLLAGKGEATSQLSAGAREPFDEAAVVRDAVGAFFG